MAKPKRSDDLSLDFSGLKGMFSRKTVKKQKIESSSDEVNIDVRSVINFIIKYRVVLLLLIPLLLGVYIRIQPADQHYTEQWAEDYIRNLNNQIISQQKSQEFPNLPSENLNALVAEEYARMKKEGIVFMVSGGNQIQMVPYDQAVQAISDQYRQIFQDENGQNYLHDIDTWLWYGYARNYVNSDYKYFGNAIDENGNSIYTLRNGRNGQRAFFEFHPWSIAMFYRIGNFFSKDWTLIKANYYISVFVMALATIPVFFIGRKIAGDLGGLVAAAIFAIQPALLSRTLAGVADTDPWTVFFPVLLTWIFVEAFETQNRIKKLWLIAAFGVGIGYFYIAWTGGWWYVFDFVLGMLGIFFAYQIVINYKSLKGGIKGFIKKKEIQGTLIMLIGIPISTFIFGPLIAFIYQKLHTYGWYLKAFVQGSIFPLIVASYKDVATTTHWPNVLTTVAELNPGSVRGAIGSMGGNLLFIISIIGIIATILRRNDEGKRDVKLAIFLTLWYIGTLYATTMGIRFTALLVPAFAIALGAAVGIITRYVSVWGQRELSIRPILTKAVIIILVVIILSGTFRAAYSTSKGAMPIINDAWYNALTAIKNDSDDAIISSWWDFGHHFVVIAERRVTFDGGDQGRRIHWIGKTLLTRNEEEAVGILRMLNCDQEVAIDKALNYSANNTYDAVHMLYDLTVIPDRNDAKDYLMEDKGLTSAEADNLLESTHCDDLLKQYYITSEDMVGKSGVWGHFGSWDFNRSMIYNSVRGKSFEEGSRILTDDYGIGAADAARMYTEIQTQSGDAWVSPWPGYVNQGPVPCEKQGEIVVCQNGAMLNLTTMDAFFIIQGGEMKHPKMFSYIDENGEFKTREYTENLVPTNTNRNLGVSFIPTGDGNYNSLLTDELLVGSIFTRLFYYNGHGLRHFEELITEQSPTTGKIQVWRTSFEPHDPIEVAAFMPKQQYYVESMGWLDGGAVFDSTITDWETKFITNMSDFEDYDTEPRSYVLGRDTLMPEIENALKDMEVGDETIISILPQSGYPNDPVTPAAEELRNVTIYFKLKVTDIQNVV